MLSGPTPRSENGIGDIDKTRRVSVEDCTGLLQCRAHARRRQDGNTATFGGSRSVAWLDLVEEQEASWRALADISGPRRWLGDQTLGRQPPGLLLGLVELDI